MAQRDEIRIQCSSCGVAFRPYVDGWVCPACDAKHPDLPSSYRLIALFLLVSEAWALFWYPLIVFGLLGACIAKGMPDALGHGVALFWLLGVGWLVLTPVAAIAAARATPPVEGRATNTLVWGMWVLGLVLNVAVPIGLLCFFGMLGSVFTPITLACLALYLVILWFMLRVRRGRRQCLPQAAAGGDDDG